MMDDDDEKFYKFECGLQLQSFCYLLGIIMKKRVTQNAFLFLSILLSSFVFPLFYNILWSEFFDKKGINGTTN